MKILSKINDFLKKDYESSVLACGFLINPYNFVEFDWTIYPNHTRGVFGGFFTASTGDSIEYITIATTGNAVTFGNFGEARKQMAGVCSSTRGVFVGGSSSNNYADNRMDYITIMNASNTSTFGTLEVSRLSMAGVNSAVRGIIAGGQQHGGDNLGIYYITIATTGNSTSFGNLFSHANGRSFATGVNSDVRGIICGGSYWGSEGIQSMEYITMATTGNSVTFGNLTQKRISSGSANSLTRGIIVGGWGGGGAPAPQASIDYVTIATTGNAVNFGNLTVARSTIAGCNSDVRGCFAGGAVGEWGGGAKTNVIDYITIATTGNAVNFGNLTSARSGATGVQNGL